MKNPRCQRWWQILTKFRHMNHRAVTTVYPQDSRSPTRWKIWHVLPILQKITCFCGSIGDSPVFYVLSWRTSFVKIPCILLSKKLLQLGAWILKRLKWHRKNVCNISFISFLKNHWVLLNSDCDREKSCKFGFPISRSYKVPRTSFFFSNYRNFLHLWFV